VNLISRISLLPTRSSRAAAALLGAEHPLVRDLERAALTVNQSLVVAAVLVGAGGALVTGSSAALPVVIAATVTEVLLACRAAATIASRRMHALDLIRHGRGNLPIPEVERMSTRLRRPGHRQRLAHSIEALLDEEVQPFDVVTRPWWFMRDDLVAPVRLELKEIAVLLRDSDAGVQGIAVIKQLLGDGTSVLHGGDVRLLREELRRVRLLLGTRSTRR
jgi:hypothetical protein